ncbi:MAG: DJ-1/PfpI family protein [bacterium]
MKLWLPGMIIVLGILFGGIGFGKEPDVKTLMGRKVVMVIAFRDFRDEEFFKPYAALTEVGAEVVVASTQLGKAKGMLGQTVSVNMLIEDVVATRFDAIVFVGGGCAQIYFDNPIAHRLAQDAVLYRKVLGAICVAPETLAHAGVLKGVKVTGFSSIKPALGKAGALVQNQPVVRDGNLITADGPQSAGGFAAAIIEALEQKIPAP